VKEPGIAGTFLAYLALNDARAMLPPSAGQNYEAALHPLAFLAKARLLVAKRGRAALLTSRTATPSHVARRFAASSSRSASPATTALVPLIDATREPLGGQLTGDFGAL
jgi:hypothetical protein